VGLTLRRLSTFAAVYVVLMSPWWLQNYHMYGKFVRLDLGDGITLVLENSEAYERHGFDWSIDPPWTQFSGITDPVSRNEAMKSAALDYIRRKPALWLRTSIDRLGRFFAPWPSRLTENTTRVVPAFAVDAICTALIAPFLVGAFCSLFWMRRRWRLMLPALLPIVFSTALHTATHSLMRYRIPIDPLLLSLAGGPLALAALRVKPFATALLRRPVKLPQS
jgi:hypothetical protein